MEVVLVLVLERPKVRKKKLVMEGDEKQIGPSPSFFSVEFL
jgi:superfamily I DNA and/or RNA helicase